MPGAAYICHQVTLARPLTADDVTNTGGVWNSVSFVEGDYLMVYGHMDNTPMGKADFESSHCSVSFADPTTNINQYHCTDMAGVVDNHDGTYTVYMDGNGGVVITNDVGFDQAYTLYT
jgi:hypothetical protein